MNKFEKLIEYIINDEDQKARELFHDIVVEKSRDIYESIMDEEQVEENLGGPVAGNQVENMVDEISGEEAVGEDDEEGEEEFSLDADGEDDGEVSGDFPADAGAEAGEHQEIEDQVMNIDAKLDELLAKFDEIMGGDDMTGGADDGVEADPMAGAEEPAMDQPEEFAEAKEGSGNPFAKKGSGKSGSAASGKSGSAKSGASGKPFESKKSTTELMREYVDKIQDMNLTGASEGDAVGAAGKKTSVNTKPGSVGPGNDFGGDANMAHGGEQNQDGTSAPSSPKPQDIKSGNRNVPGGKAGSPESTGHEYTKDAKGAEGKTTDGSVPVAKKSVQVQNTGKK
jgi:hypothetical protein